MGIGTDKWLHFTACGIVSLVTGALLALLGAGGAPCIAGAVCASLACGLGKEYGDHCSPVNRWDWADVLADFLGAMAGAAIVGVAWVLVHSC